MRMFGTKRDEIIRSRWKLYNEVLHNVCCFPNFYNYNDQIKEDEIGRHVSRLRGKTNEHRILVGWPKRKAITRET
jgi:hypothetical protein